MSNTLRWIVSVVVTVLMTSAIAFGQSTTGTLEGTVKDSTGAVIPGASVTVSGVNVGFNQTVTANDSGFYRIERVPAGRYKVTVAPISGFAETSIEQQVVIEKTSTADVTMGLDANVIDVTVGDDPLGVVVDSSDSKVQSNIPADLIDKLPSGTTFSSILKVAPGTRGESLTGGFTVDGASKAENTFLLDGQEVTSYRHGTLDGVSNIPTSLVKEVQVKTSGFEAEHGGASGGVISVITKSGTDRFSGEFGAQFMPLSIQPNNRFVTQNFINTPTEFQSFYHVQQPKDDGMNFYPSASLGGPVIKKHLWFYGVYSPQIFTRERTVNFFNPLTVATPYLTPNPAYGPETYSYKERYEYAQGRLDYSLFNNLSGFTSYLWNPHVIDGSFPLAAMTTGSPISENGLSGPATAALKGGRENSNVFTTQLNWTPFNFLSITGRYGHGFINSKPNGYGLYSGPYWYCLGSASAYTGAEGCDRGWRNTTSNGGTEFEVSKRDTFNIDAIANFAGFGRHTLKGGYETAKLSAALRGSPNTISPEYGRIVLYYGYDPVDYGILVDCVFGVECIGWGEMVRYGESGQASNKTQAFYIQDKWQISRLTLNLGFRAESENLPAFNTGTPNSIAIPISIPWDRKIVPRLGASFDLFGNGKSRLFASYGWFTDRMKFELPIGSFGGALYKIDDFPILASNPQYSYYTVDSILGSFPRDIIGGGDPSTQGGLAQWEGDGRIPSNLRPEDYLAMFGVPFVGVDPDLKPFMQEEFTVGFETELSSKYVFSSRYTRKRLLEGLEDIGYVTNGDDEVYTIGNPGSGIALQQREDLGLSINGKPRRLYNAFEVGITRRFADNYYFAANYTYSSLRGNYAGLANSDYWDGGSADGSSATRASPGVNRFFDQPIVGFTLSGEDDYGPLATDRPHQFKAYGGYTFDWWGNNANATELSFFTTAMSGTPQTTVVSVNTGYGVSIPWKQRGDMGRTPMFTQTDLTLSHTYKFGRDGRFKLIGDITVMNAFNENNVTALNPQRWLVQDIDFHDLVPGYNGAEEGFEWATAVQNAILNGEAAGLVNSLEREGNINNAYGMPSSFQAARNIRFGFRFNF